jgi:16S rRNA (adenine1518-N6/adenine1519-N6)-dimethyltransferase
MQTHRHKKQLGQHFLHDAGIIDRIVRAIDPQPGDALVEIGPGAGAITFPLLQRHGALRVIEFDRDLLQPLQRAGAAHGALEILHSDVLDVDLGALAAGSRIRLVGNLPYNISSPILFHALAHADSIQDMHFMLQKEVVDRMAAAPGNKVYGRLSVMLQACCTVVPLFVVPPGAFRPPPKVDSAVVRLLPRPPGEIGLRSAHSFSRVVKAAFAQRRKTLRNALSEVCTADTLHQAGISPSARAETIAVEDFITLANLLPDDEARAVET